MGPLGALVPALAVSLVKPVLEQRMGALALAVLLSSCAAAPPTAPGAAPAAGATPAPRGSPGAQRVQWGGQIVAVDNRVDRTELEILGYPLDPDGRPDTSAPSLGRFVAVRPGFLDPADYAPGRLITASGSLGATRPGTVGSAPVRLATLEVESLRLWPRDPPGPRVVPYGTLGIGFGSGGFYGGGVGIGIGF